MGIVAWPSSCGVGLGRVGVAGYCVCFRRLSRRRPGTRKCLAAAHVDLFRYLRELALHVDLRRLPVQLLLYLGLERSFLFVVSALGYCGGSTDGQRTSYGFQNA